MFDSHLQELRALLESGGFSLPVRWVFREDLERHPRNARALFGLHASLTKQRKDIDAAWVKRAFDEAWKNADTALTIEAF